MATEGYYLELSMHAIATILIRIDSNMFGGKFISVVDIVTALQQLPFSSNEEVKVTFDDVQRIFDSKALRAVLKRLGFEVYFLGSVVFLTFSKYFIHNFHKVLPRKSTIDKTEKT